MTETTHVSYAIHVAAKQAAINAQQARLANPETPPEVRTGIYSHSGDCDAFAIRANKCPTLETLRAFVKTAIQQQSVGHNGNGVAIDFMRNYLAAVEEACAAGKAVRATTQRRSAQGRG